MIFKLEEEYSEALQCLKAFKESEAVEEAGRDNPSLTYGLEDRSHSENILNVLEP